MGGTTFEHYSWGKTPREAFDAAVEEAAHDHGHGGYTGTIAEKASFVEIPLPDKWKKDPEGYADFLIEDDDARISAKWGPAGCIVVASEDVMEDIPYATTQERYDQKGARKWETFFSVNINEGVMTAQQRVVQTFTSQTEAEKFAKDWVKKNNLSVTIKIGKRLANGKHEIIKIHPKTKQVKSTTPLKKYLFFGWASC